MTWSVSRSIGGTIEGLRRLAALGIQTVICPVKDAHRSTPLEVIGRGVIPGVAGL